MATRISAADCFSEISKSAEADLLAWLEGFMERLNRRIKAVADEVQYVVEAMDSVELNLQNTFNSFRCLSSSQFVENHVCEEDETDFVKTGLSNKDAKRPSPTESYEDDILPRYKEAVALAWAAFQIGGRQEDKRSTQPGSRNKARNLLQGETFQILPHIIGSEEFARDVNCGLADLRHWHLDPESDTEVEKDREGLASEPSGARILSEGDISATDSDAFDTLEEGTEPAVSAALDFRAMLEAALRNPSLPYDGGTSIDALYGEFTDNRFSLPNLGDDNFHSSPRTISTMVDIIGRTKSTMDESKDKLRGGNFEQSTANVDSTQLPLITEPLEILQDDITPSSSVDELLDKPSASLMQSMLNQKFKQYMYNNNGSRYVGAGDPGHVGKTHGELFDDDAGDTGDAGDAGDAGFYTTEDFILSSNTEPSIPEGLFEETLLSQPIQHKRVKSHSLNSFEVRPIQPLPQASLDVFAKSSSQDSESVSTNSQMSETGISQSASSLTTKLASSTISSGSNVILGLQASGQLPFRGGLFDDDEDEEDEDALFGGPAPAVDSHPVLRPWVFQTSKGLIVDIVKERDRVEIGSTEEGQHVSDSFKLTSQYGAQSGDGASNLPQQPVKSTVGQTSFGSTHVNLVTSSGSKETLFHNQSDVKDSLQLPFQPNEGAAVRSSVPFIAESDDDSWSGSDSGVEEVVQGKGLAANPIQQDATMKVPSREESGANEFQNITAALSSIPGSILDLEPESIDPDSEHLSQSLSSIENTTTIVIQRKGEDAAFIYQTAPEVPPAPSISRSFSSTETAPVKISVQSKTFVPLDGEASDSSDLAYSASSSSNLHGVAQRQLSQDKFSGTVTASDKLQPPRTEATGSVSKAPSSIAQNSGKNLISEDLSTISSTIPPLPVKEPGRPTRTFTALFDDDDDEDAEDELFGKRSPKR